MNFSKKLLYRIIKKIKILPQEYYVKIYYEYHSGKKLNFDNPIEFNQKISWLKVKYHPPILTQLADKYSVREYVKEKVGEKYLNELIAVYDKASDVDFDALPDQFVIKAVHACKFNIIVKDKSKLDRRQAKSKMKRWLKKNQYYRKGLEWAYKNITPRIIAEKYLDEIDKEVILDYKFWCFNGVPKFLHVDVERGITNRRRFFDLNWNKLEIYNIPYQMYSGDINKPSNFEEMIDVATKLADKFPFVRVDLYSINNRTIFGEMTFYPADGRNDFHPLENNKIIGNYITLPKLKKGQKVITEV